MRGRGEASRLVFLRKQQGRRAVGIRWFEIERCRRACKPRVEAVGRKADVGGVGLDRRWAEEQPGVLGVPHQPRLECGVLWIMPSLV